MIAHHWHVGDNEVWGGGMFAVYFHRDGSSARGKHVRHTVAWLKDLQVHAQVEYPHPSIAIVAQHTAKCGHLMLLWDGRIDGFRSCAGGDGGAAEQANWLIRRYARCGVRVFEGLRGPFACAIVDCRQPSVSLVRDPLGQRYLSRAVDSRLLSAGCLDAVVAIHPWVSRRAAAARFAVLLAPGCAKGVETVFEAVSEALPGQVHRVAPRNESTKSFWSPADIRKVRFRDAGEYAECYRELLSRSVGDLTDSPERTAISLSGGLDSSPIAALAAKRCSAAGAPSPLAVSWRFSRTPGADEGSHIEAVCEAAGLSRCDVSADDLWPFACTESWSLHDTIPMQDNYRLKLDAGYRAAAGAGCKILLTGTFGDDLYASGANWLRSLLRERELAAASANLCRYLRRHGVVGTARLIRRAVASQEKDRVRRFERNLRFLTHDAAALVVDDGYPGERLSLPRPEQGRLVLGLRSGNSIAQEREFAARFGVELRYPFLDLPLVEYMLGLPTRQLWQAAVTRPLLRTAMCGIVPRKILERRDKATFIELHRRLYREGRRRMEEILAIRPSVTRRLLRVPVPDPDKPMTGFQEWLLWQVLSLEHWLEHSRFGPALRQDLIEMLDCGAARRGGYAT